MSAESQSSSSPPGVQLEPHLELGELIGTGGMGAVYRARDTRLGRDVAIKLLPPALVSLPGARERFQREARALALCSHANVLTLFGCSPEGASAPYLVSELVVGSSLAEWIEKRGPLPWEIAAAIVLGTLRGLSEVHRRGIVHRDVKAANVLLTADGCPKIADFGVARLDEIGVLTGADAIVGTARYLPPEALEGGSPTPQVDVYATGCLLYELIAGTPPYDERVITELCKNIAHGNHVRLTGRRADVWPELDAIVERALAVDVTQRFPTAESMAEALAALLTTAGLADPAELVRGWCTAAEPTAWVAAHRTRWIAQLAREARRRGLEGDSAGTVELLDRIERLEDDTPVTAPVSPDAPAASFFSAAVTAGTQARPATPATARSRLAAAFVLTPLVLAVVAFSLRDRVSSPQTTVSPTLPMPDGARSPLAPAAPTTPLRIGIWGPDLGLGAFNPNARTPRLDELALLRVPLVALAAPLPPTLGPTATATLADAPFGRFKDFEGRLVLLAPRPILGRGDPEGVSRLLADTAGWYERLVRVTGAVAIELPLRLLAARDTQRGERDEASQRTWARTTATRLHALFPKLKVGVIVTLTPRRAGRMPYDALPALAAEPSIDWVGTLLNSRSPRRELDHLVGEMGPEATRTKLWLWSDADQRMAESDAVAIDTLDELAALAHRHQIGTWIQMLGTGMVPTNWPYQPLAPYRPTLAHLLDLH